MNRIAIKNAVRHASIAAKRTINRAAYRATNVAKKVAKPISGAARRAASTIKTGAYATGRVTRSAAKRAASVAKSSAKASARLFSAMNKKISSSVKSNISKVTDAAKEFARVDEARIKSKRYYKKRLSKNLKMARKGVMSQADAGAEAFRYAKSKYRKRQANKVIAVGGSVVLLGYGLSEAAKRIEHNVNSVLAGLDTSDD